jgi:hypothetical protein
MWTREESKRWIEKSCGEGWLILVDEVYDRLPSHLIINQAYQKWGLLRFDLDKEDKEFETFLDSIEEQSGTVCELCGEEGTEVTVSNWIHTRCKAHS